MAEKNASRTYNILIDLLHRNSVISVGAFTNKYHCSEKTIRNEMKMIKEILKKHQVDLIYKKKQGYQIINHSYKSIEKIEQDIKKEFYSLPIHQSERVYYILKRFLLTDEYITIDELSNELFISRVSISQSLKRVREILEEYHLHLDNKPHYGLKLIGNEKNIRKCIIEHGIGEVSFNFLDEKNYRNIQNLPIFKDINLLRINQLIKEETAKAHISFYDAFYNNLIIHVAVAIKRIKDKNYIETFSIQPLDQYKEDILIANVITNRLEEEFDIVFPQSEINYIAVHIISNRIADIDENRLFLDETYILVNKMLLLASKEFDIDFISDDILKKDLYIHIKSTLSRLSFGIQVPNPMISQLKEQFPFAFEIVVNICHNKEIELYELNEEELGYVAIHFAASLERFKERSISKRKVLIFCASGIGTVRLLEAKLKNEFKNYIEITTLYDMSHLLQVQNDYDLILSTIPLKDPNVDVLYVSPLPTKEDMINISRTLLKKRRNLNYKISDIFQPELFSIYNEQQDKEELLKTLSQYLYERGYVDEKFYEGLLEREKIVDTGIGNLFAIPHPIKNVALKNGIYICILKKPIQWTKSKQVSVIFVLVIRRSEAKYFEKVYNLIADIASDIENVHKIIDCNNFNEVMDVLNFIAKDGDLYGK